MGKGGHIITCDKIDEVATNGLSGEKNSLAYRVNVTERHFHGREKWFGAAAVPNGEIHVADRVNGVASFRLTAGNNTFGNWVQLLGSSDTPVIVGSAYFDFHRIMVTNVDSTSPYLIQIVHGESADIAGRITAEDFTELPYISDSPISDVGIAEVLARRFEVGTKAWARCLCVGQNAKVMDLYFGIHEYEG